MTREVERGKGNRKGADLEPDVLVECEVESERVRATRSLRCRILTSTQMPAISCSPVQSFKEVHWATDFLVFRCPSLMVYRCFFTARQRIEATAMISHGNYERIAFKVHNKLAKYLLHEFVRKCMAQKIAQKKPTGNENANEMGPAQMLRSIRPEAAYHAIVQRRVLNCLSACSSVRQSGNRSNI